MPSDTTASFSMNRGLIRQPIRLELILKNQAHTAYYTVKKGLLPPLIGMEAKPPHNNQVFDE